MNARVALVVALTLGCSSGTRTITPAHADAMRDSVRSMLDDFRRYAANSQWDSLVALYVSDSTLRWIEEGQVRLRSGDALRKYYGALPLTSSIETTFDTLEVLPVAPGVASVLTHYHTTVKDSTRPGFSFGGLLTITVVHQPSGWRILNGHTSSPRQQPASAR